MRVSPRGITVNVLDCSLEISAFETQSSYYVYFRDFTIVNGMNSLISKACARLHLNLKIKDSGSMHFSTFYIYTCTFFRRLSLTLGSTNLAV